MRTISAQIETGIGAHVTEPEYLVECLLTPPLRWATAPGITWNAQTWETVGLEVLRHDERGGLIRIRNDDLTGSSLVLNNQVRDTEFRVYIYYNGDAREVFRGYGGASRLTPMSAEIELYPTRAQKAKVPYKRIAPPIFTKLPKVGDTIHSGGEILEVTN